MTDMAIRLSPTQKMTWEELLVAGDAFLNVASKLYGAPDLYDPNDVEDAIIAVERLVLAAEQLPVL